MRASLRIANSTVGTSKTRRDFLKQERSAQENAETLYRLPDTTRAAISDASPFSYLVSASPVAAVCINNKDRSLPGNCTRKANS
jgi:hypothetical protein